MDDIIDSPLSLDEKKNLRIKRADVNEQDLTIGQHRKSETHESDSQADLEFCVEDTSWTIGPDFPGDLSAQPFQDPFDENCDGGPGLWEAAGADSASIFDPFDDPAFHSDARLGRCDGQRARNRDLSGPWRASGESALASSS